MTHALEHCRNVSALIEQLLHSHDLFPRQLWFGGGDCAFWSSKVHLEIRALRIVLVVNVIEDEP